MYGLPNDTDLSFFLGQELLSIAIGKHHVEFKFDDAGIVAECKVSYKAKDQSNIVIDTSIGQGADVLSLIGRVITNVTKVGRGDLKLEFSTGSVLIFHEDDQPYESYNISSSIVGLITV